MGSEEREEEKSLKLLVRRRGVQTDARVCVARACLAAVGICSICSGG